MSFRERGLKHLKTLLGREPDGRVYTSRYYPAEESWLHVPDWWFGIPTESFSLKQQGPDGVTYLVGEEGPTHPIVALAVPNKVLRSNLQRFHCIGNGTRIKLLLVAVQGPNRLHDHGPEGVDFGPYEM